MNKPAVTGTNHLLPFGELSPDQFERLCLWLVELEGHARVEHLGEAGSEQGRDVTAWRGEQLWYFQCKRYLKINATTLIAEVEKYNEHIQAGTIAKPHGIVFVTNAVVSAKVRKQVESLCQKSGFACEWWARTELDLKVKKHDAIVKEFFNLNLQSAIHNPQPAINITLPPPLTPHLFGRDDELRLLDEAWATPATKIVVFHALGGAGKSALVSKWLARMAAKNYYGAQRIFGWSFFSQGSSENRSDSSEAFIDSALAFFGVTVEGDYFRKADRLAEALRAERTILILDGVEPLQYPPNTAGLPEGGLKDRALQTILNHLAAQQPGLCIITSRERLSDLNSCDETTVIQRPLDHLPYETTTGEQPCAQLLRVLGAVGDDAEMLAAAREFQGHAFGLTLLGSYVAEVLGGDLRRRKDIANLFDDDRFGSKADRMIAAYETWLGAGVEIAILRLLGLFDRPAEATSIAALRAAPVVPGLTETLQGLSDVKWQQAVSRLRRIYLVSPTNPHAPHELDAHPLVREHFRQQLKTHAPDAWRAGNLRLYEHLTRTTEELPNTVEKVMPFYRAVVHGCEAGKFESALKVYWEKIQRKNQGYASKKLEGEIHQLDLSVIANFFKSPWDKLVDGLTAGDRAYVLSQAGAGFNMLGLPKQAIPLFEKSLNTYLSASDYKWASSAACSLSGCHSVLGDLDTSLKYAERADSLAQEAVEKALWHFRGNTTSLRNNEVYFTRVCSLVEIATVLHQMGRIEETLNKFKDAENYQKQNEVWSLLYSTNGYCYNDLLLDQGNFSAVLKRASKTMEWSQEREAGFFSKGLENISIGRALLLRDQKRSQKISNRTIEYIENGVDLLRRSGVQDFLISGLLMRSTLNRILENYQQAQFDLDESRRIAERGEMRLHLADCYLGFARLSLATGDRDSARKAWETAKAMIEEMGYHRRDGEVAELSMALGMPKTE